MRLGKHGPRHRKEEEDVRSRPRATRSTRPSPAIHLDDAAAATVLALDHDGTAIYNITEARGAANAKANEELGWVLRYPRWRQGFPAAYGRPQVTAAAP
jgi:hypothetical protein